MTAADPSTEAGPGVLSATEEELVAHVRSFAAPNSGLAGLLAIIDRLLPLAEEGRRVKRALEASMALTEKLAYFTKNANLVIDPIRPTFTDAERRAVDAARRRRSEIYMTALVATAPGEPTGEEGT